MPPPITGDFEKCPAVKSKYNDLNAIELFYSPG